MPVPAVNLRPALAATHAAYEARLAELFTRQQFILGEQVRAFEQEFAAAMGASDSVGVGNGTDAIALCLRAAGVGGSNKDVITSALTAPFTGVGITAAGCRPRFADVDPRTLRMSAGDAQNRARKNTAAVVPVHLYGQPCDLPAFRRVAKTLRAELIQDACQAHGASYQGKPLTAYSSLVAYSFYPTKNLGCLGDGGAITTGSKRLARKLRELRDGGRRGGQVSFTFGINSRLDEMQACYLRAFLEKLAEWNADRAATARFYDESLRACPGVQLVERTSDSVCHLYVIRAKRRDRLRAFLSSKGIGTGVHYPVPLHLQPAFSACGQKRGDLPHAEKAAREIVSLPLWPYLPRISAEEVVTRVWEFYRA
ncbi:MAG: DegT/DnrJ/EryC1/StrS family aminotransferase [Candidatus Solibacter usitatus]|nr:DegT/DnrJ/EryC1/StrS family aminotransferase [Candidatus Solibacter usitatus]